MGPFVIYGALMTGAALAVFEVRPVRGHSYSICCHCQRAHGVQSVARL